MNYEKMTDSELAQIMVNYISRINNLEEIIGRYLEGNRSITADSIKNEYSRLKKEIMEDAHYVGLQKNCSGSSLYMGGVIPSLKEAVAFGFMSSTNAEVNQMMFNSIVEAQYKMTKYYTLEEWRELTIEV